MCGICGILSPRLSSDGIREGIDRMVAAMRHRGPDDCGAAFAPPCGLGQTRLAVIDASPAGHQPMEAMGVTLVFNGEIYNFQEQRRRLEREGARFHSDTDTEVLLALYLRHGADCVAHLRGMYAFAFYDSRDGSLFCGRDPFGIKPLLYTQLPDGLAFASELKALLASGLASREVDRQSLRALLQRGSVPQPHTILKGVHWLPAGHTLTLRPGQPPRSRPFFDWDAERLDLRRAAWPDLVALGRERLMNSVRRQMVADVPLGAFLSGGIDSALAVALMTQAQARVRTFSVGFEGGLDTVSEDETNDALLVARHLGVEHRLAIISGEDAARSLPAAVAALDHPTVDGLNSWFVSRAAAGELTVALSGTGGDELFAGYPWFRAMRDFMAAPWPRRLLRGLRGRDFTTAFDAQYRIFPAAMARALCPDAPLPFPRPDPLVTADPLCRVTGMLLTGYTRDQLLADIDTASMGHGLEVRVPFLDEPLLRFALSLPPQAKLGPGDPLAPDGSYAHGGGKRLLLEIGQELLPPGFARRAKRGFTLPMDAWLRRELAPYSEALLSPEAVARRGFFTPAAVTAVRDAFDRGRAHWTQPWLLLATELWAQEVLDAP